MHFLLPAIAYLPVAAVLFVLALWLSRRFIPSPRRRSAAQGGAFAVLFGISIVSVGHGGAIVMPAWMLLAPVPRNWMFFPALIHIAVQAAFWALVFHGITLLWPRLVAAWRRPAPRLREPAAVTAVPSVGWKAILLAMLPGALALAGMAIAFHLVEG